MRTTPGDTVLLALAMWCAAVGGVVAMNLTEPRLTAAERVGSVLVLTLPSMGALVAVRRPAHPVGWLLLGGAVLVFDLTAVGRIGEDLASPGGSIGPEALVWLSGLSFVGLVVLGVHVPLRFPDGRLPSPAWRRWERIAHLGTAVFLIPLLFAPGPLAEHDDVVNPFGVEALDPVEGALSGLGFALVLLAGAAALASLVVRWRRGGAQVRQQLRWLILAAGLVVAAVLFLWVNPLFGVSQDTAALAQGVAMLVVLPAAIGVAILRHGALDIDVLVRRSLVYGALWLGIAAVYLGVAIGFGVAAGQRLPVGAAVILTVLATVAFSPARRWLLEIADRRVFGSRPTPPQLIAGLGGQLGRASEPREIAASLAQAVRAGLRARWVEVHVAGPTAIVAGEPEGEPELTVPIVHGGERLGTLRCGPREDTGSLAEADLELVQALAAHTGLALHSAALAARLVEANETERRRIQRNIHDGAQQQLVALMARLGIARQQLRGTGAEPTLVALQHELRAIMEDLRALAQGIHPSVLSDGGLIEAVTQRCDSVPLPVTLEVGGGLAGRRLSDETEGAGYFLVSEALANVLKHSRASGVVVQVRDDRGHLAIEVADDGVGFDVAAAVGGGLGALADRLAALGGTLDVTSAEGAGTRVRGRLPLRRREEAGAHG